MLALLILFFLVAAPVVCFFGLAIGTACAIAAPYIAGAILVISLTIALCIGFLSLAEYSPLLAVCYAIVVSLSIILPLEFGPRKRSEPAVKPPVQQSKQRLSPQRRSERIKIKG
jgi:hypothetical protein